MSKALWLSILVTGFLFGCGQSKEQAVQELEKLNVKFTPDDFVHQDAVGEFLVLQGWHELARPHLRRVVATLSPERSPQALASVYRFLALCDDTLGDLPQAVVDSEQGNGTCIQTTLD